MLLLSRKPGESIQIGPDVVITVTRIGGNRVRLGITAPQAVRVTRTELTQTTADCKSREPATCNG